MDSGGEGVIVFDLYSWSNIHSHVHVTWLNSLDLQQGEYWNKVNIEIQYRDEWIHVYGREIREDGDYGNQNAISTIMK